MFEDGTGNRVFQQVPKRLTMQLSLHAEYALRVLLYLGACPRRIVSTEEISRAFCISRNHLVRVVQTLGDSGYVHVTAGRSGGVSLARAPLCIRLGEVVQRAEPNFRLAECFDMRANTCPITSVCLLKPVLKQALDSFVTTLNCYTLDDLLQGGAAQQLERKFIAITVDASNHKLDIVIVSSRARRVH